MLSARARVVVALAAVVAAHASMFGALNPHPDSTRDASDASGRRHKYEFHARDASGRATHLRYDVQHAEGIVFLHLEQSIRLVTCSKEGLELEKVATESADLAKWQVGRLVTAPASFGCPDPASGRPSVLHRRITDVQDVGGRVLVATEKASFHEFVQDASVHLFTSHGPTSATPGASNVSAAEMHARYGSSRHLVWFLGDLFNAVVSVVKTVVTVVTALATGHYDPDPLSKEVTMSWNFDAASGSADKQMLELAPGSHCAGCYFHADAGYYFDLDIESYSLKSLKAQVHASAKAALGLQVAGEAEVDLHLFNEQVADIALGTIEFSLGGLPINIVLSLPVNVSAELDLHVQGTGQVQASGNGNIVLGTEYNGHAWVPINSHDFALSLTSNSHEELEADLLVAVTPIPTMVVDGIVTVEAVVAAVLDFNFTSEVSTDSSASLCDSSTRGCPSPSYGSSQRSRDGRYASGFGDISYPTGCELQLNVQPIILLSVQGQVHLSIVGLTIVDAEVGPFHVATFRLPAIGPICLISAPAVDDTEAESSSALDTDSSDMYDGGDDSYALPAESGTSTGCGTESCCASGSYMSDYDSCYDRNYVSSGYSNDGYDYDYNGNYGNDYSGSYSYDGGGSYNYGDDYSSYSGGGGGADDSDSAFSPFRRRLLSTPSSSASPVPTKSRSPLLKRARAHPSSSPCPLACSGHGACINETCTCSVGWQGPGCQFGRLIVTAAGAAHPVDDPRPSRCPVGCVNATSLSSTLAICKHRVGQRVCGSTNDVSVAENIVGRAIVALQSRGYKCVEAMAELMCRASLPACSTEGRIAPVSFASCVTRMAACALAPRDAAAMCSSYSASVHGSMAAVARPGSPWAGVRMNRPPRTTRDRAMHSKCVPATDLTACAHLNGQRVMLQVDSFSSVKDADAYVEGEVARSTNASDSCQVVTRELLCATQLPACDETDRPLLLQHAECVDMMQRCPRAAQMVGLNTTAAPPTAACSPGATLFAAQYVGQPASRAGITQSSLASTPSVYLTTPRKQSDEDLDLVWLAGAAALFVGLAAGAGVAVRMIIRRRAAGALSTVSAPPSPPAETERPGDATAASWTGNPVCEAQV